MRPEDTQVPSQQNRGGVTPPQRSHAPQQQAVANMTRSQIEQIYSTHAAAEQQSGASNPAATQHHQIDSKQWETYHSSWQNYYQKYYEKYYVDAVSQAHNTYQRHAEHLHKVLHEKKSAQPHTPQVIASSSNDEPQNTALSEKEAIEGLRSELLDKVQHSAKKIRKSRHFVPAIAALSVLLVFGFLQYNAIIFSYAQAYVSPGNIDPQNIIVDPSASLEVSKEPRLIVPRFNIDVAVQYENTMGSSAKETHDLQMAAMRKGVAYFGAGGFSALPGEKGNFGIAGHSSNDFTDGGAAKFVFAPLLKMKKGDVFYLNYKGIRYTYNVTKIQEVKPTGVGALDTGTKKPMATLITCTPLGTADRRLLIFGEQVSPSPSEAKSISTNSESVDATELTGKSPTVFERLFGN